MALIKCFECSKEISDTAKSCPHCGAGRSRECHECYERISEDLETCPNCGAPRELEEESEFT
jgi:RNA polymerase subunit RPABC4/transcription elongation factor Spt4